MSSDNLMFGLFVLLIVYMCFSTIFLGSRINKVQRTLERKEKKDENKERAAKWIIWFKRRE